jgi:hypothetical protein
MRKLWDIITEKCNIIGLEAYQIRYLVRRAIQNFNKFFSEKKCDDNISMLVNVQDMYRKIWNDPNNKDLLANWSTRKRKKVNQGPPSGNDLIILSTVIYHSNKNKKYISLLTLDYDFIIFKSEIKNIFDVQIEDGWLIPD